MGRGRIYEGIDKDPLGAMNQTGTIIRDAWVFGIIPESETCAGWAYGRIEDLYAQVSAAWEPYAHLPSQLPTELREKHQRIYAEAMDNARKLGWDPDAEIQDEG
jgi:hypothetical protein